MIFWIVNNHFSIEMIYKKLKTRKQNKTGRIRKALWVGKKQKTTQMVKMFVRHKTADFDKWKIVFEEVEPFRKQLGSSGSHVFSNNANPNEVFVITDWDNKEQGMKFGQSSELKNAMQLAWVIGAPEINYAV